MQGWRHLHTRAETGALGSPGFQTVAAAPELAGKRREALDDLVSRAMPRGGTARKDRVPHRRLLIQPSPTDLGHCVLTRIEPRADSFDGAPGNHWAESFVVPQAWLARSGWNLAAAFEALDWWGPRRGLEEIEDRGGAPAELPEEDLPELPVAPASPDPEILRRLADAVPDRETRLALLAAFAQQAESDADPAEPVYGVAGDDGLEPLEELLLLLPLVFPPAMRARRDTDGRLRCLRLATLGEPDSLAAPDLLGLREARIEDVRGRRGVLVDLTGAVPLPALGEQALEQARRVERLRTGEGSGDAAASRPAAERDAAPRETASASRVRHRGDPETGERRPPTMTTDTPSPNSPGPAASGDGGESPGAADARTLRAAHARQREVVEEELGGLMELLHRERESLLAEMREHLEQGREEYQDEVKRLRRDLQALRQKGKRDLQDETERLQSEIRGTLEDGLAQLQRTGEEKKDLYSTRRNLVVRDLEALHNEALHEIDERRKRAENAIKGRQKKAAKHLDGRGGSSLGGFWAASDADEPLEDEADRSAEGGEPRKHRGGAHVASGMERFRGWIGSRPFWLALTAVLVVVALGASGWVLWLAPQEPAAPGDETGQVETPEPGRPPDEPAPSELEAEVLSALARQETASRLLREALDQEALRNRAAQAFVLVALGPDQPLTETTSCALVQKVVSDWQTERGTDAIGVDGNCGSGTRAALAPMAEALGCTGADWQARAACVLNRQIAPARAAECDAAWPFERTCRWQVEEARSFLGLLRRTARVAAAVDAARYDLLADPDLAGRLPALSADDARDLLPLAYLVERAADDALPEGTPWKRDLDRGDLERIRSYLAPPEGTETAGAGDEEGAAAP